MSELIERLRGHIETLRGVASSVYSDDIQEAVDEIERLTAELKATESNEQVLVDANKPLLVRIAKLEAALQKVVDCKQYTQPELYEHKVAKAALKNTED